MNAPDPKQDQSNAGGGAQHSAHPLDNYTVAPKGDDKEEKSPYYKSSAPSISLPKGGGALKGIDEKFTVNAVNGTASLDVPLPFTQGRGGFTPSLSISYNSGSGNSEFGLGWAMSLPDIRRKTDKKLPRYNDTEESDVFLMAGAEDLVPLLIEDSGNWVHDTFTDGGYIIKRYRPRIEGLWARIEHITKAGISGSWWKVTTKENVVTFYGLSVTARLADPDDIGRIYRWLPQVSYDNKGNVTLYSYIAENLANVILSPHEANRLNGYSPIANIYLKRVKYCNRTHWIVDEAYTYDVSTVLPDEDDFLMEAVFDYGEHDADVPTPEPSMSLTWPVRADAFSDFHAGFEIRTYRRCKRVLMFHYFDELDSGAAVLVRSVDFNYQQDDVPTDLAEADFITSISQSGYMMDGSGGYYKKTLPPITMSYQPISWDNTVHDVLPDDIQNAPQGLTDTYQWIDLYGEGLQGILTEQGHGWFYKRNLGDGHFTPALSIAPKPSIQGLGKDLQWQDLEADGRRQLVSMAPSLPGYYELDDDQEWQPFHSFPNKINVDWHSPYTRMLDLDGDGRADLLITEERVWKWYENEGKEGYVEGGYSSPGFDEEKGPRLLHNDMVQTIFLADMNGDGLTDIVRIKNGEVCYWPNKGYGNFGAKVAMSNAPLFDTPTVFNPIYITLADISGTGAPDLIYLGQNKCTAWINLAGNGWGNATDIFPLPGIDPQSKIMVADFLGNGTASIVWSSPLPHYAHAPMRYVDLMGGNKPYLMTNYNNGMGKSVELQYKQSTKYYLEDRHAGKEWATMLPFPVHCVKKIITSDSVSQTQYSQQFSYHHGYYDHEEREFRGFGRVETIDTDTANGFDSDGVTENDLDQYPVLTKTWYHTGAWMREHTLLEAFFVEYYPTGWAELPIIPHITDSLNPQEQREAYRALKGQALRQEVYALDASSLQGIPYSVATHVYCIKKIQPLEHNRFASFYSYQRESLAWAAERNVADPRVTHNLTLSVDEYGNVLKTATVAYPRIASEIPGGTPTVVADIQQKMLATYTANAYTNDILTGGYHLRVVCDAKTYELTGATPAGDLWECDELLSTITGADEIAFTTTPTTGAEIRILSQTRNLFQGNDATTILSLGTIESLALPYTHYALAFTDDILTEEDWYDSRVTGSMLTEGGYMREDGIAGFGSSDTTRYWLPGGTNELDAAHFFTATIFYDPWGKTTTVTYWDDGGNNYYLLPQTTTDAVNNITTVNSYNWYNLQPTSITDINENQHHIVYDALGMPVAAALMEKDGSSIGDTISGINPNDATDITNQADFFTDPESVAADLLQGATWRCVYDLNAAPVSVGMIARELYNSIDPDSPLLVRLTYTDGLGRQAMQKVQAAPEEGDTDPRWIGSGKIIYNNKGKEVMQYEPYFTDTPLFDYADYAAEHGVTKRIHYDALGRIIHTDLPDGSFTKTDWDTWRQALYDNNDTVDDSDWYTNAIAGTSEEADAADKAHKHYDTPTITYLDTLGREFYTILHDKYPDPSTWTSHYYESYVELDIQGEKLVIHDARGLTPHRYSYNMVKALVGQLSIDSGMAHMLVDAEGHPFYGWDADERQFHYTYDDIRRQLTKEVFLPVLGSTKVLEVIEYGEDITDDTLHNLRGKPYNIYDGSGLQCITDYDFNDKPLNTIRTFVADHTIHPDWTTIGSVSMETDTYTTETTYDAFERLLTVTTPDNGITTYAYERTGLLFSVRVDDVHSLDTDIINEIYYNSKRQRLKVKYENSATTTYEYDPKTFRVTRIRTTRSSDSAVLQDLKYWYDPVGNITLQKDDAQQSVYYDNTVADPQNDYTYDALYRLIKCEGREHAGSNAAVSYNDGTRKGLAPLPTDASAMRRYAQYYSYDEVGNMLQMKHTTTGGGGNWTRNFTIDSATNQLTGSSIGSNGTGTETYTYDTRGNMADGMNHLLSMEYNEHNRLEKVEITASTIAYYQYDKEGQRVRKVIINTTGSLKYIRKYIGGWEVYQKINTGTDVVILERESLHVMDDKSRVALIDTPTVDALSTGEVQTLRYQFSNNTNTASLEIDDTADVITYEEYYPYGNTSYQGGRSVAECSLKRYRYTGEERDEETGLNYHGARYYAPWLARWLGGEPLNNELYHFLKPKKCEKENDEEKAKQHFVELTAASYEYCYANPVRFIDPTGEQPLNPTLLEKIWEILLPDVIITAKRKEEKAKEEKAPSEVVGEINDKFVKVTWGIPAWDAINQFQKVKSFTKISTEAVEKIATASKWVGGLSLLMDGIQAGMELHETGHVKNSTFVNSTIDAVLLAAAFTPAAPVAAVVGAVWALIKIWKGDSINKWFDSKPQMLVPSD